MIDVKELLIKMLAELKNLNTNKADKSATVLSQGSRSFPGYRACSVLFLLLHLLLPGRFGLGFRLIVFEGRAAMTAVLGIVRHGLAAEFTVHGNTPSLRRSAPTGGGLLLIVPQFFEKCTKNIFLEKNQPPRKKSLHFPKNPAIITLL